MAHKTAKTAYHHLIDRLNRFPQGAPPSDLLFSILKILFSEKEAELVSTLPIKPFTAKKVAKIWKMDTSAAQEILDELAGRAILVDIPKDGETQYCLPPPMAGFFEFSMMRLRNDVDQHALGELFYQYMNVEEDFIKHLFYDGETQLGRAFVHEPVLSNDNAIHVLDYERASEVIKTASHRAVGICYCRHKMEHVGQACDAPMEICMTFNNTAASLSSHGFAREIDVPECIALLEEAYDHDLVQFGENVREQVAFICNCCGCCCEAMIAARRFGSLNPIHTTNFIPHIDADACTGCGKCVTVCPVEAMALVSANDAAKPKRKTAKVDERSCLGCGVCVKACQAGAISLESRPERVLTPLDTTHKVVLMAIERGQLQNLIFDNRVLFSHRALAAVFGVILKLPPVKQLLATKQLRSNYLEALVSRYQS